MAKSDKELVVTYDLIATLLGVTKQSIYQAAHNGAFSLDSFDSVASYYICRKLQNLIKTNNLLDNNSKTNNLLDDDSEYVSFDPPPRNKNEKPINPWPDLFTDYHKTRGVQVKVPVMQLTQEQDKDRYKYAKDCADYYATQKDQLPSD